MNNVPADYVDSNRDVIRDRQIGQRLAFTGGARMLHEAAQCIDNAERLARWKRLYRARGERR